MTPWWLSPRRRPRPVGCGGRALPLRGSAPRRSQRRRAGAPRYSPARDLGALVPADRPPLALRRRRRRRLPALRRDPARKGAARGSRRAHRLGRTWSCGAKPSPFGACASGCSESADPQRAARRPAPRAPIGSTSSPVSGRVPSAAGAERARRSRGSAVGRAQAAGAPSPRPPGRGLLVRRDPAHHRLDLHQGQQVPGRGEGAAAGARRHHRQLAASGRTSVAAASRSGSG